MAKLVIDTGAGITQVKSFDIFELVKETDPILKKVCEEFNFSNPPYDPAYLASSLFETMFKYKGLGLSACQVGIPYRVFTCGSDDSNKQVFFNPKITEVSDEKKIDKEGCLSYTNLFLRVERPLHITVEYQHVNGEVRTNSYHGLTARVICHEIDHLNGITFLTKAGKVSTQMAMERRAKLNKKLERTK